MRVYTYPGYVDLGSAQGGSPKLFKFLEEGRSIKFEGHAWHGTLDSLPRKPALVRASTTMKCGWEELGARCAELGHLCFYDDRVLLSNGRLVSCEDMANEVKRFLESYQGDAPDVPKEKLISYLRSTAADHSTAGETVHTLKQAELLHELFVKHVLLPNIQPSQEISGEYQAVRVSNMEHPNTWNSKGDETAGLDLRGMSEIRREVAFDAAKTLNLPYDHPVSQAFYRKLAKGLEENFYRLKTAYETTEIGYQLADVAPNLGILLHNFRGRHSQWSGVVFLRELMTAMLPPLVNRLVAEGYSDNGEIIEWEYEP